MACAISSMSDTILKEEEEEEEESDIGQALIRQYYAKELIPGKKLPLQDLLQKQPAALGIVQVVAGITSIGLGVTLAATAPLSLAILLRVPIFTGLLFLICGSLCSLLSRITGLLPICFMVNIGCLSVAGVGIVLLSADLSVDKANNPMHLKEEAALMKILILCITLLETCVSAILLFWMRQEMRRVHKTSEMYASA